MNTFCKVFAKISSQCKVSFNVLGLQECIFELFLLKKQPKVGGKWPCREKIKLVLKTIYKVFLQDQEKCQVSFIVLGPREWIFRILLLKKQPKVASEKNKLGLKTTYKKVFIKYQANARFPSVCLPSGNAIFSRGRRWKKMSVTP